MSVKVLYTTHAIATGGRNGHTRSADGIVDVDLSIRRRWAGRAGPARPRRRTCSPRGYAALLLQLPSSSSLADGCGLNRSDPAPTRDRAARGRWLGLVASLARTVGGPSAGRGREARGCGAPGVPVSNAMRLPPSALEVTWSRRRPLRPKRAGRAPCWAPGPVLALTAGSLADGAGVVHLARRHPSRRGTLQQERSLRSEPPGPRVVGGQQATTLGAQLLCTPAGLSDSSASTYAGPKVTASRTCEILVGAARRGPPWVSFGCARRSTSAMPPRIAIEHSTRRSTGARPEAARRRLPR